MERDKFIQMLNKIDTDHLHTYLLNSENMIVPVSGVIYHIKENRVVISSDQENFTIVSLKVIKELVTLTEPTTMVYYTTDDVHLKEITTHAVMDGWFVLLF